MTAWLFSRILWLYSYFAGITSRTVWIGRELEQDLVRDGPCIYTFWHNRQAMLLYYHKAKPIWILISPSKDGEIVARVAGCYKVNSVRGSSRRKSREGLLGLMRVVHKGGSIAITPDGPLGPAGQIKGGVVYLAQALGIPILPLAAAYSRKIVFNSWDAFQLPLPFGRIAVGYAEPFWIKKEEDSDKKAQELKIILDDLTRRCDDLVSSL